MVGNSKGMGLAERGKELQHSSQDHTLDPLALDMDMGKVVGKDMGRAINYQHSPLSPCYSQNHDGMQQLLCSDL